MKNLLNVIAIVLVSAINAANAGDDYYSLGIKDNSTMYELSKKSELTSVEIQNLVESQGFIKFEGECRNANLSRMVHVKVLPGQKNPSFTFCEEGIFIEDQGSVKRKGVKVYVRTLQNRIVPQGLIETEKQVSFTIPDGVHESGYLVKLVSP